MISHSEYSQLSLDISITRTLSVEPSVILITVAKLTITRTALHEGQLEFVPTASVLEIVECTLVSNRHGFYK